MNQHIHCSVNNCHYWAQGNKCEANEIMITSDSSANQYPDRLDATQTTQFPPTPVQSCMESCCKTFVPANSRQINADGIRRQQ